MDTIAVIDDDIYIGDMLEKALSQEGYQVLRAYSGTEALLLFEHRKPDLVLLDLMLPGLAGEQVLGHLKGIPVIVVSARTSVDDKVELLTARIRVQLRTQRNEQTMQEIAFGGMVMKPETREITVEGADVHLTPTEFAILKQLMQNPDQVVTKSRILDAISMDTPDCTESSLKIHVSNLRKKLKEHGGKDYIEAVWGIGFKLRKE